MVQYLICHFLFINATLFQVRSKAINMVSSPHKDGGFIFQGQWEVCLFIWTMGGGLLHMGDSQLEISLGRLQHQYLAQVANDNLIKCYFDNLGDVFIHWVHYWSSKGSHLFSEMLNPHQYNDFINLVKRSFVAQVFYNTVL